MVLRVTWLQSGCKVHRISSSDQPDQPVGSVCRISPVDFPTPAAFLASQYCDMLETMYVRCTHCGYDNSPEYRFCGMCGGSLAHPVSETRPPLRDVAPPAAAMLPVAAPVSTPPQFQPEPARPAPTNGDTVHGPSFLGLSEDPSERPKVEFNYLYEEEPTSSHAGLIAVLLLLVGAGGFLAWQWRHHGFPFNRFETANSSSSAPAPAAAAPDASQGPVTPTDKPAEKPASGAGDVLPTEPDQHADSSGKSGNAPGQEKPNTAAAEDSTTHSAEQPEKAAAAAPPVNPRKSRNTPANPRKSRSTKLESTRAKSASVETAALATPPDADLELAGERYLYGSGLPQNCVRAESSLRAAATHGNPKAETVLGTMYATGHCVGRDLPTAYRWFARALHQDPQNSRISADLQVLWRQMTPKEQQLATTSKQ